MLDIFPMRPRVSVFSFSALPRLRPDRVPFFRFPARDFGDALFSGIGARSYTSSGVCMSSRLELPKLLLISFTFGRLFFLFLFRHTSNVSVVETRLMFGSWDCGGALVGLRCIILARGFDSYSIQCCVLAAVAKQGDRCVKHFSVWPYRIRILSPLPPSFLSVLSSGTPVRFLASAACRHIQTIFIESASVCGFSLQSVFSVLYSLRASVQQTNSVLGCFFVSLKVVAYPGTQVAKYVGYPFWLDLLWNLVVVV
ncbi:hypothetical protein FPQ18DRAFT_306879 [Pyronema domesticum]|nr:hypothetical protein FPQ18DRAFT_306879 [Pyronema domesticum]